MKVIDTLIIETDTNLSARQFLESLGAVRNTYKTYSSALRQEIEKSYYSRDNENYVFETWFSRDGKLYIQLNEVII